MRGRRCKKTVEEQYLIIVKSNLSLLNVQLAYSAPNNHDH
jgi:hypothetical protein